MDGGEEGADSGKPRREHALDRRIDREARVRLVWKDGPLPFHPRALPAAELARSARAQKDDAVFWNVHDKLFAAQPDLEDRDLLGIARAAGLDAGKAESAIKTKQFAKGIAEDQDLAEDLQSLSLPLFFVNGLRIFDWQYETLKALVDAEMTKAEARVRGGVAKTAVYDAIMKDGKDGPEPERRAVAASIVAAPFRGAANAKVVIQEFSDFQSPHAARVEPTIDALLKAYPTVMWRNTPLPFGRDARFAAEAAHEAFVQKGNDGFSKMRALLFAHQADRDGLKRTALEGYAATVGLDMKKFGKALDDRVHTAHILADAKAAADAARA